MQAPHKAIRPASRREEFLVDLLDTLWERYRGRVEYARRYEALVEKRGATFLNDHVAFRTICWQRPQAGVFSISRVFEALGYRQAGCYEFPDKHLSSLHFAHPNRDFPKLFISQLKPWELTQDARDVIGRSLDAHRPALCGMTLAALNRLDAGKKRPAGLLEEIAAFFSELPWKTPRRKDVEALNEESQFGAWVLLNGYEVNHFTASVDRHGPGPLSDIEKTVAAMKAAGIPMKGEIEGARGSRLRQSATEAVMTDVPVMDGPKKAKMKWTYAYFELAERPLVANSEGKPERFEGFFGGQATNLFEMTKVAR
jgi:hypothetical protein